MKGPLGLQNILCKKCILSLCASMFNLEPHFGSNGIKNPLLSILCNWNNLAVFVKSLSYNPKALVLNCYHEFIMALHVFNLNCYKSHWSFNNIFHWGYIVMAKFMRDKMKMKIFQTKNENSLWGIKSNWRKISRRYKTCNSKNYEN
jgi:hypothetical protein